MQVHQMNDQHNTDQGGGPDQGRMFSIQREDLFVKHLFLEAWDKAREDDEKFGHSVLALIAMICCIALIYLIGAMLITP